MLTDIKKHPLDSVLTTGKIYQIKASRYYFETKLLLFNVSEGYGNLCRLTKYLVDKNWDSFNQICHAGRIGWQNVDTLLKLYQKTNESFFTFSRSVDLKNPHVAMYVGVATDFSFTCYNYVFFYSEAATSAPSSSGFIFLNLNQTIKPWAFYNSLHKTSTSTSRIKTLEDLTEKDFAYIFQNIDIESVQPSTIDDAAT